MYSLHLLRRKRGRRLAVSWALLLLAVAFGIHGEARGQKSAGSLFGANLDCAVYYDKNNMPYVEIYYAMEKSAFSHEDNEPGEAAMNLLLTTGEKVLVNESWRMRFDKADTLARRIVDMFRYGLDPGDYQIALYIADVHDPARKDSLELSLSVAPFNPDKVHLSDIELAASIQRSQPDKPSTFSKNTLDVIPNPSSLYGDGRPVLFYYVESYNLLKALQGDQYRTRCSITRTDGREVSECPQVVRTKAKKFNSSVEVGTLNISKVISGTYQFNFEVLDEKDQVLASRSKKIYIFNSEHMPVAQQAGTAASSDFAESEFATMPGPMLEHEFDILQYLLNDEGKKFYANLQTNDARRKFIYSFWRSRDPNPATKENEYRIGYLERMQEANEKYGRMGKEGWRTDRGRVYMIYGKPTDIEYFPSSIETYPHEIWIYNDIEGGVEFVFVDATGFNEYVLVHSTATGEIKDFDWRKRRASVFR